MARALLTLGVTAAATTGFVTPAFAQEEWDAPADAVAVDTTQTETAAQKARRETDDAIREAARMLLDPGCNSTISGSAPAGGESAATVLEKLSQGRYEGGDGKIYDMHTVNKEANGLITDAEAPVGAGSSGYINLYMGFHDEASYPAFYYSFGNGENQPLVDAMFDARGGAPSTLEYRAFIILHELAHLTGQLNGTHGADDFAREAYNSAIYMNCLRPVPVTEPACGVAIGGPPAPCPDTSGGGGGGGSGVILVGPGGSGGGGGAGSEPLPESDDPVIDFGSDAPVITGEDGSVIDGGDVGEAYGDPYGEPSIDEGSFEEVYDPGYYDPGYDDGGYYGDPGGYPDYYDPGYGDGGYYGGGYDDGGYYGGGGGGGGGGYYPENDSGSDYYAYEYSYY